MFLADAASATFTMGGQREGEGVKEKKEGNREGIHPRPAMTSGSVMG